MGQLSLPFFPVMDCQGYVEDCVVAGWAVERNREGGAWGVWLRVWEMSRDGGNVDQVY